MSGGIQHVEAAGMKGIGTRTGIRFKSAKVRGGVVQDVFIHDVTLEKVATAILINLNWFPTFSYPAIPAGYTNVPPVWNILATKVPAEKGIPRFRDITITDVKAVGSKTGITAKAYPDAPIERVTLKRVDIEAQAAGGIQYAKDWTFEDVTIIGTGTKNKTVTVANCAGVTLPAGHFER
jgi:polygalacturonase